MELHIQALREFAKGHCRYSIIHGVTHWDRVYDNGLRLLTPEVNANVVAAFAYLHDSCREDDGYDEEHGPRAAEMIKTIRTTLLAFLSDEEFDMLTEACRHHTTMQKSGNPTVDACFDADRLDLWRVGIEPDPDRMATKQGAHIASTTFWEPLIRSYADIY